MPSTLAGFLTKPGHTPKTFNDVQGERLRTVRLRGQVSQGMLLPVSVLGDTQFDIDDDVTEILNIQKWEAPINPHLAGLMRGNFPSFVAKTNQNRIQNLGRSYDALQRLTYEVTEKCEGSSMTAYYRDGVFGVCSRNIDLVRNEDNAFWAMAIQLGLEEKMTAFGSNIAVQGELIGPGIQDNIYKLNQLQLRVFDIFSIDMQAHVSSLTRLTICEEWGLMVAPVVNAGLRIDGMSMASEIGCKPKREGLVFKAVDGYTSFKTISNAYLLKQN
jgi:RNA ligase (TIGR02306 family)